MTVQEWSIVVGVVVSAVLALGPWMFMVHAKLAVLSSQVARLDAHVPVFGPGSSHARHDDLLTDFRSFDGRDLLVVRRQDFVAADFEPYFERVAFRRIEIRGAVFHLVDGRGFRFPVYRERVLDEIRRRYYALPAWLPRGPCDFCDRYFPERACHR